MKTNIESLNELFKFAYGDYREDGSKREFEERDGYRTEVQYEFPLTAGHAYEDGPIIGYETRTRVEYTEKPIDRTSVPCKIYREIYANGEVGEWRGHTGRISDIIPKNIAVFKKED